LSVHMKYSFVSRLPNRPRSSCIWLKNKMFLKQAQDSQITLVKEVRNDGLYRVHWIFLKISLLKREADTKCVFIKSIFVDTMLDNTIT
jgi:hypothetical protein